MTRSDVIKRLEPIDKKLLFLDMKSKKTKWYNFYRKNILKKLKKKYEKQESEEMDKILFELAAEEWVSKKNMPISFEKYLTFLK